jgi:hypothetical protein
LGLKRPSQIEGFIAAAEAARAHVEAKIPSGTWEKLSYHHTELLKDPKGHLVLLRKENCTLR